MPITSATAAASTKSTLLEQYSESSSSSQFFMKMPTTSWPCCLSSHALTAESTPPDRPTTTRSFLPMAAIIPPAARHTRAMDERELQGWIGRTETRRDVFGATPPAALAATLDQAPRDWTAG